MRFDVLGCMKSVIGSDLLWKVGLSCSWGGSCLGVFGVDEYDQFLVHRPVKRNILDLLFGGTGFSALDVWALLRVSVEQLPRLAPPDVDRVRLLSSDCARMSSSWTSNSGEVVSKLGSRCSTNFEEVIPFAVGALEQEKK